MNTKSKTSMVNLVNATDRHTKNLTSKTVRCFSLLYYQFSLLHVHLKIFFLYNDKPNFRNIMQHINVSIYLHFFCLTLFDMQYQFRTLYDFQAILQRQYDRYNDYTKN